jgi:hypothetical protein
MAALVKLDKKGTTMLTALIAGLLLVACGVNLILAAQMFWAKRWGMMVFRYLVAAVGVWGLNQLLLHAFVPR